MKAKKVKKPVNQFSKMLDDLMNRQSYDKETAQAIAAAHVRHKKTK